MYFALKKVNPVRPLKLEWGENFEHFHGKKTKRGSRKLEAKFSSVQASGRPIRVEVQNDWSAKLSAGVCGNTHFKASALWADAFYKSKCPSVCVFVRPCVCLFTFEVPFNGLFAPTSQSRMSDIFRDLESLGKSNGKKWSNI